MLDLGKVRPGSTLRIPFSSFDKDDGSSITMTNYAVGDILIYKDGSTTERASTAGFTATTDFDSKTGKHLCIIDLADNTTSGFFAAGSEYLVAIDAVTIDGVTTGSWIARFTIGYDGTLFDTTIATLTSQTSFTLTNGPADNNALVGCDVVIHDQASAVQLAMGVISAYTGATKTAVLAADPGIFTMAAGDNISIYPRRNMYAVGGLASKGAAGYTAPDFDNLLSTGIGALILASVRVLSGTKLEHDGGYALKLDGVSGSVSMTGNCLQSAGTTTLNALTIAGNASITGTTTLHGAVTADGAVTITGAVSLGSTLTITGKTTLAALDAQAITATTLATSGTATFNALTVTNATTLSGAVSLGSTLTITGKTTLAALDMQAVTLTTLTASGAVAFQSTFAVTTSTNFAALTCSKLTATAEVAFKSTFDVTGGTTLAGLTASSVTITGALTANNASNFVNLGTDAITAGVIATNAVAEIQSGLATQTSVNNVKTVVDAVQAKTDNLPSDPADQSLIIAATDAVMARLGAPVGASMSADIAAIKTVGDAVKVVTDKYATMIVLDGAVYQFTANALELAPGGSGSDHWSTNVPASYAAGTAGYILGNNLDAKVSDAIGSGAGTGARTRVVVVNDGAAVIQGAEVRATINGVTKGDTFTNTLGSATLNLDDATYTLAITAADFQFAGTSLVVAGDGSNTYSMTPLSVTPSAPTLITGVLIAYDENRNPASGIDFYITPNDPLEAAGTAFADATGDPITSGVAGITSFPNLQPGFGYTIRRGTSGKEWPVEIPADVDTSSNYSLPSVIGNP
jgi:hypothetical protein